MKQMQIINAVRTLDEILSKNPVIKPMALSYNLFLLRRSLQKHWDWQEEREMTIRADIANMNLSEEEIENKFNEMLKDIVLTDVEPDWDVVKIPADADIMIHPTQFMNLVGFIDME